jgi:multiple sugar transport system ATP-binding protein
MAVVSLEHISKVYPPAKKKDHPSKAIDDISFTIADKEFMVIVGPSGCGKSTLLRMIAGLEEISSGTLKIDDRVVNDVDPSQRDIAMVFQNYALYPHMTVYENMAFGLRLKNLAKNEIEERVMQAAQLLEMEQVLDRKPKTLSGGQRQRVAIGRAIVRRPKVFLFDEPLSNLDAKLRSQMRIELQKLHREINATMIYVTHDQTEAMTLGNRIAVLSKGKLMQLNTPLHLYTQPENKFVAGFIGSPAMNFIAGTIQKQDRLFFITEAGPHRISLETLDAASLAGSINRKVVIGVRPEDVILCEDEKNTAQPDIRLPVNAYENMGNEQLIYLSIGKQTLIARRPPKDSVVPGEEKEIRFLRTRMLFIDEESGNVIYNPAIATS